MYKNQGEINEKELYHGSGSTPPIAIYRSEMGFDFRFTRPNGLWGFGAYFAAAAAYSNTYAYLTTDGMRQIILAKVLTGITYNTTNTDPTMRKPPLKPDSLSSFFSEERYDSVCTYARGSKIHIIYDHEKLNPAYLISYQTHQWLSVQACALARSMQLMPFDHHLCSLTFQPAINTSLDHHLCFSHVVPGERSSFFSLNFLICISFRQCWFLFIRLIL